MVKFKNFLVLLVLLAVLSIGVFAALPTQNTPLISSSIGLNTSSEDLLLTLVNVTDSDGDNVTNITDWRVDGSSMAIVNVPFEVDGSLNASDYSTYGNGAYDVKVNSVFNSTGGYNGFGAYEFPGIIVGTANSVPAQGVRIPRDTSFLISGGFTVSAWVKPKNTVVTDQDQSYGMIASFYQYGSPTNQRGWYLGDSFGTSDHISFSVSNIGTSNTVNVVNFTQDNFNNWTHVVATYEPSQYVRIYVNGQLAAENNNSIISSVIYPIKDLTIGTRSDFNQGMWNGSIDDFKLFDRVLSSDQILNLYNGNDNVISSDETVTGENWIGCNTPNDRTGNGTTSCSSPLTIIDYEISACGQTFYSGITNYLANNISASLPFCLIIDDKVDAILDCNGYTISNASTAGITLTNTTNMVIQNCVFENNNVGISLGSSFKQNFNLTIKNNQFLNNTVSGISDTNGGQNFFVRNNNFLVNGLTGISTLFNNSVIEDNVFDLYRPFTAYVNTTSYTGITTADFDQSDIIIRNNNISNFYDSSSKTGIGIFVGSSDNVIDSNFVINNNRVINSEFGIATSSLGEFINDDFTIFNNYFKNITTTLSTGGMIVYSNGTINVSNNKFFDIAGVGTHVTGNAFMYIINNTISGIVNDNRTLTGIILANSVRPVMISNNFITNFTDSTGSSLMGGILGGVPSNGEKHDITIFNNTITNSDFGYLDFGNTSYNHSGLVIDNNIMSVEVFGILLRGPDNVITNNIINNDANVGFPGVASLIFERFDNGVISGNTVGTINTTVDNIAIRSGGSSYIINNVSINNNVVTGGGSGFYIENVDGLTFNDMVLNGSLFSGTAITFQNVNNFLIDNVDVTGMDDLAISGINSSGVLNGSSFNGIDASVISLTNSNWTVQNSVFDDVATATSIFYTVSNSPLSINSVNSTVLAVGDANGAISTIIVNDQIVSSTIIDGVTNYSVVVFNHPFVSTTNTTFFIKNLDTIGVTNCSSLLSALPPDPSARCDLFLDRVLVPDISGSYDFTPLTSLFNSTFNVTAGFQSINNWVPSIDDSAIFSDGSSFLNVGTTNTFTSIGGTLIIPWKPQHQGLFPQSSLYADLYNISSFGGTLTMENVNSKIVWNSGIDWEISKSPRLSVILGPKFISVDSVNNPKLDNITNITMKNVDCSDFIISHSSDFETNLGDIITLQEVQATTLTPVGGDCTNASICGNVVCNLSTSELSFTSYGFSSFGIGNNTPPVTTLISPDGTVLPPLTNTITLLWSVFDLENDPIIAYQLQIDDINDFTTPLYNYLEFNNDTSRFVTIPDGPGTYFWRVRSADNETFGSYALAYNFTVQSLPIVYPPVKEDYRDQILFILIAFSILVLIISTIIVLSYILGVPITTGSVLTTIIVLSAGFSILMTVLVIVLEAM